MKTSLGASMAMESDNGIGKWQMQMYGMNRVVLSGETRVVVCGMQHVSVQFFKLNNKEI